MSYRRRPTPIHAARAAASGSFCLALVAAALLLVSPILLGALVAGVLLAAAGASVLGQLRRLARFGVWFALGIVAINALVTRDGLTVILRLGDLPLLGRTDVTLEAVAGGGVLALRAVIVILAAGLFSSCVDPDELLRGWRRLSFASALSATLATRLVPILARDSRRVAEAQRCRPGPPPSRLALARAVTSGMLDRALDVAATLELRGYGGPGGGRAARRPWSRHDVAFALAGVALVVLGVLARATGSDAFTAYPKLELAAGTGVLAGAATVLALCVAPFLDRRGVET